ncbi:MAG: PBSX family phage terminase large subunit [Ruminiclostridium sp.]|nr:PBSX family phage terminase large subunit [Ruminiclostridium sp.]
MIQAFSPKQRQVLGWWRQGAETAGMDAIICDGAVRSGKTLCLGLSFLLWTMTRFHRQQFALCGKTTESVRRNLLSSVLPLLEELGFAWEEKISRNWMKVRFGGRENTFFLFGGKDEGSAALIQGVTLAGVLLDEVALMPRSFVEQACARCSVTGAKFWFSCNPEGPGHWFYKEWICKAEERRTLHLRFFMEDNPALSEETRQRYERAFQGAFYRRFVLGEWTAAEGLVYDFFDESLVREAPEGEAEEWVISCDYGTVNPTSMGLWGRYGETWYRVKEYYYDAREEKRQQTDQEYAGHLRELAGDREIRAVVADPSAASFLEVLRREGWPVRKAKNDVLSGIRLTADALKSGRVVICAPCADAIREFGSYCWDLTDGDKDRVKKQFDHAMDEIRYFVATVVSPEAGGFWAGVVERKHPHFGSL